MGAGVARDARFHAVLRLDRILNKWPEHWNVLESKGYAVTGMRREESATEVRRFLMDWVKRMQPVYMAVSLPDTFAFPEESVRGRLLEDAVLPACREAEFLLSLMIGVRYQVNPALRLAAIVRQGRSAGTRTDVRGVSGESIPGERSEPRKSARVVVYTRKFANLMPFGCWWFLNNPSIVRKSRANGWRCWARPSSRSIPTRACWNR